MFSKFLFDLFYLCIIDSNLSQIFFYLILYLINLFKPYYYKKQRLSIKISNLSKFTLNIT